MITGRACPELGGRDDLIDVNYMCKEVLAAMAAGVPVEGSVSIRS
jgi:hypothetical protein